MGESCYLQTVWHIASLHTQRVIARLRYTIESLPTKFHVDCAIKSDRYNEHVFLPQPPFYTKSRTCANQAPLMRYVSIDRNLLTLRAKQYDNQGSDYHHENRILRAKTY